MAREVLIGVEWIVALLMPNVVAPHPNFSTPSVTPVGLLALLADGRHRDYDRYLELYESSADRDDLQLQAVDAVRMSLFVSSQAEALVRLSDLRNDSVLSPGLRSSLVSFESLCYSEIDRLDLAVEVLDDVLMDLASDLDRSAPGAAVIEAALRQQKAVRSIEMRELDGARREALSVESLLTEPLEVSDSFSTSNGTTLSPRQAQIDIANMLRDHALAVRSTLEGLEGELWKTVVRSPLADGDIRAVQKSAEGGISYLEEHFRATVSWSSGRRRFAFQDTVDGPLSTALVHAEVAGDLGRLKRLRATLGLARALRRRHDDPWAISDSLRLLRQADARQELEDVIRWVRASGPVESLQTAANAVLGRPSLAQFVTRCDLAILMGAAEVMSEEDLGRGIDAAFVYGRRPETRLSGAVSRSWSDDDLVWRSCARMLPGSGRDDELASAMLDFVAAGGEVPDHLAPSIVSLVVAISWTEVSDEVRARWESWVHQRAGELSFYVSTAILDAIGGVSRRDGVASSRPQGLELGVRILQEFENDIEPRSDELYSVVEACRDGLAATQQSAARGRYSYGAISAGQIAVAMIDFLGRGELWEPLASFLRNPDPSSSDKQPVLDQLAVDSPEMPDDILDSLRGVSLATLGGKQLDVWNDPVLPVSPAALRFSSVYGLIGYAEAIDAVTQLGGSRQPESRVEAARSANAMLELAEDYEWITVFLLQLSHDDDAVVRAESARQLARLIGISSAFAATVEQRTVALLEADGILVPLLTLRGLQESNSYDSSLSDLISSHTDRLASEHPARSVRRVALELRQGG